MFEFDYETDSRVSGGSIRTATVQAVAADGLRAQVAAEADPGESIWAEIAIPAATVPGIGSRVLVATEQTGESFVIGILGRAPVPERRLELAGGASVRVEDDGAVERLRLFSADDRLLLEYDTATGRLALNAPSGDLTLTSAEGDIVLDAARAVRVSGHSVEATARSHVHLGASGGAARSLLRLDPATLRMASPHLGVTSRSGTVHLEECRYRSGRTAARVDHLQVVADRIERVVGQLHETVERAYTRVKELLEVRARRVRTLVQRSWQVSAKRAFLRSKDEFKVKGETIHLG